MQTQESAVHWQVPVRVRVGKGIAQTVRGPEEALHHLIYRWPVMTGAHYDNARSQCLAALQHTVSLEVVREAFLAAGHEAGMLDV